MPSLYIPSFLSRSISAVLAMSMSRLLSPSSAVVPVVFRWSRQWLLHAAAVLVLFCAISGMAVAKDLTTSTWDELPAATKSSLQPLQDAWQNLTAADRAKWLELSATYPSLPAAQQKRLHARMLQWVEMPSAQRNKAREAFLKSQSELATADRKAQWEAYQALSDAEKKRLSQQAQQKKQGQ